MNKLIRRISGLLLISVSALSSVAVAATTNPADPEKFKGVSVLPLESHPVPAELKQQARNQIAQMMSRGYIDADENEVSGLERARADKQAFRPMKDVAYKLKVVPANLTFTVLAKAETLGTALVGGHTEEGWTGLYRLFVVPGLGLVGLEEIDYVASGGGMALIQEAINRDVNGRPAILAVKQSRSQKGLSELVWTTDWKIYTLRVNRALQNERAIDEFMDLARRISD